MDILYGHGLQIRASDVKDIRAIGYIITAFFIINKAQIFLMIFGLYDMVETFSVLNLLVEELHLIGIDILRYCCS